VTRTGGRINYQAQPPGPRGDRSWWDESKATPPAPGGRDPLWLVVVMAFGLAVAILAVAVALGSWRSA
jgi:hypothetical protein